MAERFESTRDSAVRQSLDDTVREARGMVREGMEHQTPGGNKTPTQLSRDLLEMQQNIKEQMASIQALSQRLKLIADRSEETTEVSRELLDFFREQENGIRASVQATSNYVVEEEAQKAISQIEAVAQKSQDVLVKMEQEMTARMNKTRAASVREKVWKRLERATTIALILILVAYLVRGFM